MAYDPDTLMRRYQQLLDIGANDGKSAQSTSSNQETSSQCAWCEQNSEAHVLAGDSEGCQACCVGLVERVKQYSETAAQLEARVETLDDTWTKARKLNLPYPQ